VNLRTIKSEALCFAFLFSTAAAAQAPVSDLNQAQSSGQVNTSNAVYSLEERVAVLERIVKSRNVMQQQLQSQIDTMQGEVDELRGAVELHTNQLEKVLQRQRELYLEIDKRVESLKVSGLQSTSQPSVNNPVQTAVSNASALGEAEAYDNAVNLILKTREYDKAIPAFESFLRAYPNSEFADNAHYWMGQLLFNKQQWGEAERSFSTVINKFSDSTKRADAMLKLGIIKQSTGAERDAQAWFERVVKEYPKSSAAKLASARVQ
jgi:tol-pal system protein YbgF